MGALCYHVNRQTMGKSSFVRHKYRLFLCIKYHLTNHREVWIANYLRHKEASDNTSELNTFSNNYGLAR